VANLYGNKDPYYLNAYVHILGRKKVAGLCGTPDGDPKNEWKERNTDYYWAINSRYMPIKVSDSWRWVLLRAWLSN
jgi:hypothetical protein